MTEISSKVNRSTVKYDPTYKRFVLNTKNYVQQYNHMYLARLNEMRDLLSKVALKTWGPDYPLLPKIIDVEIDHHQKEYILIGTVYKEMKLRGSVLDEFKENNGISGGVQSLYHIASKDDTLIMEDESGRIALGGVMAQASCINKMVTGVVIAVKGTVDDQGVFQVSGWVSSHCILKTDDDQSISSHISTTTVPQENSKYILIVSGLQVGNNLSYNSTNNDNVNHGSSELSAQLLIDFVTGRLSDNAESIDIARRIVRVIVAGDSIAAVSPANEEDSIVQYKDRHSSSKITSERLTASSSKQLDLLLGQLLCCCDVDIMPGDLDPTNLSLPQQPLHPCLFPHSCRFSSFSRVTNPYEANFDGIKVLGHSGQPVTDIARQRLEQVETADVVVTETETENVATTITTTAAAATSSTDDTNTAMDVTVTSLQSETAAAASSSILKDNSLDILQDTLQWGHISPTCPDTLPCYPFEHSDPFIIADDDIPDVLFAGNQPCFSTKIVKLNGNGSDKIVRLVCVPSFALTGQAVLVDIGNNEQLTATTISFR